MTLRTRDNILSAQDYNPFGEEIRSYSRRDKFSGGVDDKYKFTGKERDKESNLDYFGARYYDSEIGRWLSVDPLAAKYPGWSPYNYCMNNPLGLVDPNGKEANIPVYVGVETQGLGHAFVVCVDDNTGAKTVWSYGRYDGTSSGGRFNPIGEGVLRKIEGNSAAEYISKEIKQKGGDLYKIPDASTKEVNNYFQNLYDNSKQISQNKSADGKVIDTYTAPVNTCVTKTMNGIKAGNGTIPKFTTVVPDRNGGTVVNTTPVTPDQLNDALSTKYKPQKGL